MTLSSRRPPCAGSRRSPGGARRRTAHHDLRTDVAQAQVLEALLIALIILGALLAIYLRSPPQGEAPATERNSLETQASDALTLLSGFPLNDPLYGNNTLVRLVTESLMGNSSNLSAELSRLLPEESEFAVYLFNGIDARPLYVREPPPGEAVSASIDIRPSWSFVFHAPDFTFANDGVDLNVTIVPVFHSTLVADANVSFTFENGHTNWTGANRTPSGLPFRSGMPKASAANGWAGWAGNDTKAYDIRANFSHQGAALPDPRNRWLYDRDTAYEGTLAGPYDHNKTASDLTNAMKDWFDESTHLSVSPALVPLGSSASVTWDFSAAVGSTVDTGAVQGEVQSVRIRVWGPAMADRVFFEDPGTGAWSDRRTGGLTGSIEIPVPRNATFGLHIVDVTLHNTPQASQSRASEVARRVETFAVGGLAGGRVPDPTYAVQLVVWLPGWETSS
ncbi:MAG: hypothetical protein ACT4PT_02775 [Methanobacteriota archaeon]